MGNDRQKSLARRYVIPMAFWFAVTLLINRVFAEIAALPVWWRV